MSQMYCKASLLCNMVVLGGKPKTKKITSIAMLTVTSPIVINVPTRDLLVINTKGSFVLR